VGLFFFGDYGAMGGLGCFSSFSLYVLCSFFRPRFEYSLLFCDSCILTLTFRSALC